MGKNNPTPSFNVPAPTARMSASELFGQGTNWAKTNTPVAFGAREQALQDVNNPNYYAGFQPTSFEQALGNQYFNNIYPNQEAIIKNQYSRTGMADSPVLADALSRAYGNTAFDVGSYLSNLGNTRAINSLNMRNIDPIASMVLPYANLGQQQDAATANAMDNYNMMKAQVDYQNAVAKQQQKAGFAGMMGQLGGAGLAAALAIPTGGMSLATLPGILSTGAGIGGALSPLWGGSSGSGGGLGAALMNLGNLTGSKSVNPSSGSNGVNPTNFANNNIDIGQLLGTGMYNTVNPFAISMSGGNIYG